MIKLSNEISITRYALERKKKYQEIADKYNLAIEKILDLSLGENLFIPPKLIQKILVKNIQEMDPRDSYPIDYYSFIEEISRFTGVNTASLYPGLTHNQLIQRFLSTITKPKDGVLLISPDKEIYSSIAHNLKLKMHNVSLLENFELDINAIIEKTETTPINAILFSSPHYPTANQLTEGDVLRLTKEMDIPIIIDESYVEFGKYSLLNQVQFYDNLTVVRSFSKAWGLGSVSSAYLASDSKFISLLKDKYFIEEIPPVNILATIHILQAPYKFVELINNFVVERKRVIEHLKMLSGLRIFKSDTNFLFIRFKKEIKELYNQLCSKGVIVQTFEKFQPFKDHEKSFLVTLGDTEINDRFVLAIIESLEAIA